MSIVGRTAGGRRALLVVIVVCLVAGPAGAVIHGDVGTADSTDDLRGASVQENIRLTSQFQLTPSRPGSVRVVFRFEIPDRVTALRTQLPERATVTEAEGFAEAEARTYVWDGNTATPHLTVRLDANLTAQSAGFLPVKAATHVRANEGQGLLFADTGPWALVQRPNPGVRWKYRGDTVGLERSATVDGEGAVGSSMVFIGQHRTVTRTANGQTFRLVVPGTAEMREPPSDVLDALANASTLTVGDRDPTVFLVAAPATIDWGVRGLQTGDTDAWVRADEPLDQPGNVWLHEYIHTRQAYEPTESTRWTIEGSANYYAALLTLKDGRIGFTTFRRYLGRGTASPQAESVLADPATWTNAAQYTKGALVAGELDRRIRIASNHSGTFATVVSRMNAEDDSVTGDEFRQAVREAGGEAPADAAGRFTTTQAVPEMWGENSHREAFGPTPARIDYIVAPEDVRVTGPYRNVTTGAHLTLVPNETLSIPTTVRNLGGTTGPYEVRLVVDGNAVMTESGTLRPNAVETVRLNFTPQRPGEYVLSVRGERMVIRVREPAALSVVGLSVNRTTVPTGGAVRITITIANEATRPGEATVAVGVNNDRIAAPRIRLGPNTTTTVALVTQLKESGKTRISAGSQVVEIRVTTDEKSTTTIPGVGITVTVFAVILAAFLWLRR